MIPPTLTETRADLQRVATHILARRRHAVSGRFGLRATPGGIGTPAFGPSDALEVVRTSGGWLVHEIGGQLRVVEMEAATLADLAALVDVDLGADFTVGTDTPDLGDVNVPLRLDAEVVAELADWFDLGWRALDVVGQMAKAAAPTQLWPEHFDAGSVVVVGPGSDDRCNVGVSPGDHHHEEPYLYVGPWGADRPGNERYWNASFGAVLPRSSTRNVADAVTFFREGLFRLVV